MPAKSKSQRRLMGAAYAYKKGEYKGKPSQKIKDLADEMSLEYLKDFAETEEDNLPYKKAKKEENNMTIKKNEIEKLAEQIMNEEFEEDWGQKEKKQRNKDKKCEDKNLPIKERFALLSKIIFENSDILTIGQKVTELAENISDTILSESDGD